MPYDPRKHRRRSIRLQGHDYTQPGAYFVTICTQNGEPLFGEIVEDQMHLSSAGEMVWRWWDKLGHKYPSLETDAAVVMPNHFHGIIVITGQPPRVAPADADPHTVGATPRGCPHTDADPHTVGATPRGRPHTGKGEASPAPGDIVGWFKMMTTNDYIRGVKQHGWSPFPGKVWQRNYYDHIIRNHAALERIRAYIETNPERWKLDRENPHRVGVDETESRLYGEAQSSRHDTAPGR
jgi:putative transposase